MDATRVPIVPHLDEGLTGGWTRQALQDPGIEQRRTEDSRSYPRMNSPVGTPPSVRPAIAGCEIPSWNPNGSEAVSGL